MLSRGMQRPIIVLASLVASLFFFPLPTPSIMTIQQRIQQIHNTSPSLTHTPIQSEHKAAYQWPCSLPRRQRRAPLPRQYHRNFSWNCPPPLQPLQPLRIGRTKVGMEVENGRGMQVERAPDAIVKVSDK